NFPSRSCPFFPPTICAILHAIRRGFLIDGSDEFRRVRSIAGFVRLLGGAREGQKSNLRAIAVAAQHLVLGGDLSEAHYPSIGSDACWLSFGPGSFSGVSRGAWASRVACGARIWKGLLRRIGEAMAKLLPRVRAINAIAAPAIKYRTP